MAAFIPINSDDDSVMSFLKVLDECLQISGECFSRVDVPRVFVKRSSLLMPRGVSNGVSCCRTDLVDCDDCQWWHAVLAQMHITSSSHGIAAFALGFQSAGDLSHCHEAGAAHELSAPAGGFLAGVEPVCQGLLHAVALHCCVKLLGKGWVSQWKVMF
jgi:hypothetical protein